MWIAHPWCVGPNVRLRLRRQTSARNEWSVLDRTRGYRICTFNHAHHEGTHLHYPEVSDPLATVDVETMQQAEAIMRAYHDAHDEFAQERFMEVYEAWKSASDAA